MGAGQSSGLVKRDKNGDYILLPLGELLLNDTIGDPYLERIESLWVIHHKLATNKAKNSTFYWIFNMNNNMVFSYDDFLRGVNQWYDKEELRKDADYASSSPKNTITTVGWLNIKLRDGVEKYTDQYIDENEFWSIANE